MPERTAYKTDANGNVVPFTYLAPAQPDPMAEQQKLIDQAYRDLPLEQAEQAAMAAMVYQGRRGYARDLENGLSAPEALSKWAPLMFGRNLGQGAAMVRANPMQQKPVFTPVPGIKGGQLAQVGNTFRYIEPEQAKPAATEQEVTHNGKKMLKIVQPSGTVSFVDLTEKSEPREYLNPRDQALLNTDVTEYKQLLKDMSQIVPQQPSWFSKGNLDQLKAMQDKAEVIRQRIQSYGKGNTATTPATAAPAAPIPAAPTITESVKRFTFDPKTRKLIAK